MSGLVGNYRIHALSCRGSSISGFVNQPMKGNSFHTAANENNVIDIQVIRP